MALQCGIVGLPNVGKSTLFKFYPTPEKEEEEKPAPSEKKPKRTKKTESK